MNLHARLEIGEGLFLGLGMLLFQHLLVGEDHVVLGAVEFDDLQLKSLANVLP